MKFQGQLLKMKTQFQSPVQYYLTLSGDLIHLNELWDRKITLRHVGYECVNCGSDEPIYSMGFCKKCFFESPYASETILKPELSKAHLGIEERDLEVERQIQLQPHIVYLAYTGDVKVGVTRESQVPTRWIDQGATMALPIARTNNRYEAGVIEVLLKKYIADKTNWRKMLQDIPASEIDLMAYRDDVWDKIPEEIRGSRIDAQLIDIHYPYTPPHKIQSFNLTKKPEYQGVLKGIKGQYLCFENGDVFNVRRHEGFRIELDL